MAETKKALPKGSRWARWMVVIGALAGIAAVLTFIFGLYDRWTGKPSTPGSSIVSLSLPSVVPAPAAKLVARCADLPMRASLEALVKRVIEQHDARYKAMLDAVQQALPPARRSTFPPSPDERDPVDVLNNGWIVNGYLWCRVRNEGNKPAGDVRLVVTGPFSVTFYDGDKLAKGGVSGELRLGELRPEFHRDVEIFSENPGGNLPDESNLKLTQADGENGKVSLVKR